jgi:serine/threonine protein kinase
VEKMPAVVIKVIRVPQLHDEKAKRRYKVGVHNIYLLPFVLTLPQQLKREITVWRDLLHPNIVPFVGIAKARGALPSLVSLWMSNGEL